MSVLKVVYLGVLVFLISNFYTNQNSQGRKLSAKKILSSGNSALVTVNNIYVVHSYLHKLEEEKN